MSRLVLVRSANRKHVVFEAVPGCMLILRWSAWNFAGSHGFHGGELVRWDGNYFWSDQWRCCIYIYTYTLYIYIYMCVCVCDPDMDR